MMAWTFDVAAGVAKNRELTDRLIMTALRMAGIGAIAELPRSASGFDGRLTPEFNEYACDITYNGLLEHANPDDLISQLAPSLSALFARGITTFVVLPELRASIPVNLGQTRIIAWYAMTMKPQPKCAVPKRHAPDCECASMWT